MSWNSFSRFENMISDESYNKLKNSTIMVIGLGGVGSYALEAIVRSGVLNIIVVDGDIIERTNINRQLLATESTLGMLKVDVAFNRIKEINPFCNVIKITKFINNDNYLELFKYKIDFILDCIDTISSKVLIIKEAISKKISIISSMGCANRFDPTKFIITDIKKTYNDPVAKAIRIKLKKDNINSPVPVIFSTEEAIKSKELCSNSFTPSVAGLIMASYAIKKIIGKE